VVLVLELRLFLRPAAIGDSRLFMFEKRLLKLKTSGAHTSMQRPQLVHWLDKITGLIPLEAPFKAGLMIWGSGQTAKQSMQSSQASRFTALTRKGARALSRL